MNVLLNNYCNQQCSYCFAIDHLATRGRREMTREGFERVLSLVATDRAPQLQLGGGEPTLHPDFEHFVDRSLERGVGVGVLTNGLFGQKTRDFLAARGDRLRLLFNINHPASYRPRRWQQLEDNLAALARFETFFGVNVHEPDQDLDYMYDLCARLRPRYLRYVVVHSVGSTQRSALLDLDAARAAGRRLVELTRRVGDDLGIRACFDCGFVPCHFDDAELATLLSYNVFLGRCGLCPVVDERLRVGHCFVREGADDTAELDRFTTTSELAAFLGQVKQRYADLRLRARCDGCPACALGSCDLGCVGDRIAIDRR